MKALPWIVATLLAVALGAALVVARDVALRNTELTTQLAAAQKSAREGWGKLYALQDEQSEATENVANAVAFAKWEVEEACRKGMIK